MLNELLGADLPRTIVADPPWWPSLHKHTKGRTEGQYRAGPQRYYTLLPVEVIEAMRPESAPKAHLYLWALNQHLDWAVRVARAWGFEPQQTLTWCKPGYGTGQFQCNTEQVLLCRKGGPVGNAFGKTGGTWFQWPRGRHSQKPEAFYDLVERVSPGPHHEMFARRVRPGWTAMGNEVTGVFEVPNVQYTPVQVYIFPVPGCITRSLPFLFLFRKTSLLANGALRFG